MQRHLALSLLVAGLIITRPALSQASDPAHGCEQAAEVAERTYGLPPGLLVAIGRVESGRADSIAGAVHPWPWAVNAGGVGFWPPTLAEAMATVESLRARGTTSIDVGCFQVNLAYHPGAFTELSKGFDPFANADYAARFLLSLRRRTGDWTQAVMAYHSSTAGLGDAYWSKVKAAWNSSGTLFRTASAQIPPVSAAVGVKIWTPVEPGMAPKVIQISVDERGSARIIYLSDRTTSQN